MAGQSDYGKCDCGAEIRWLTMASGARMPAELNAVRILVDRGDGRYKVMMGYAPHWANCPNADQHRRDQSTGSTAGPRNPGVEVKR